MEHRRRLQHWQSLQRPCDGIPGTGMGLGERLLWLIAVRDEIGNNLFVPPDRNMCIGDVLMINKCAASNSRHAALEAGSAARKRADEERNDYRITIQLDVIVFRRVAW